MFQKVWKMKFLFLIITLMSLLLIVGCGSNNSLNPTPTPTPLPPLDTPTPSPVVTPVDTPTPSPTPTPTNTPTPTPTFTGSGSIINRGTANTIPLGNGIDSVTMNYIDPGTGNPASVITDGSGNWSITNLSGTVTITPSKSGWIFLPASFEVSASTSTVNIIATDKSYTGAQIQTAVNVSGAGTISSTTIGDTMPVTVTVGGDLVPVESVLYLCAKYITLYNDGSSTSGTVPTTIPFLTITKPDSVTTTGKTSGNVYITVSSPSDGYYGGCKELVALLENSAAAAPKIPNSISFPNAWNSTVIGDPKTTEILNSPDVLNGVARIVKYTVTNSLFPNYYSLKGMQKPSSW